MLPLRTSLKVFLASFVLTLFVFCATNSRERSQTAQTTYEIEIVTVEQWGGSPAPVSNNVHTPKYLTVHHSGEDWKEGKNINDYLTNLQSWSRSERNWVDIPYHYIIDTEGKIYAARNSRIPGDTNTDYDTRGHLLTSVIGNYENAKPTEKQINALVNLLTWQSQEFNILPNTLKAHKDYANTACPGKNLYPYINNGYVQKEINNRKGNVVLKK